MDHLKASPMAYPMAVIAAPTISVSSPDFQILRPIIAALATPKLNNYTPPITITAIYCWSGDPIIPEEMM